MPAVCPLLVLRVCVRRREKSGAFRKSVFQKWRYDRVSCLTSPPKFRFRAALSGASGISAFALCFIMTRQRTIAVGAAAAAAALLISSTSSFSFSALPSSARRAPSSRCQQRSSNSQLRQSNLKMIASVPKETTADSSILETRTKPANNRLHVQVECVDVYVWSGRRRVSTQSRELGLLTRFRDATRNHCSRSCLET